jgi:uncharacterized membrane protein
VRWLLLLLFAVAVVVVVVVVVIVVICGSTRKPHDGSGHRAEASDELDELLLPTGCLFAVAAPA